MHRPFLLYSWLLVVKDSLKLKVDNRFGLFSEYNAKKHIEVIKHHMKAMQQTKLIHFRFIVLIFIAFIVPHLAFTTQHTTVAFNHLSSGIAQNSYFEKGTPYDQEPQVNLFVEAESENEDDVHDEQTVCKATLCTHQNFNAAQFAVAINTLYLRLAFSNLHKVALPFFILYHSWKSHLA